MRRVALIIMVSLCAFALNAVSFVDSNGKARTESDLSGSYSNSNVRNGRLLWSLEISEYGDMTFALKEEGQNVRLSTLSSLASTYNVRLTSDLGMDLVLTARVVKNGNVYNGVMVTLDATDLQMIALSRIIVVEISGNGTDYFLGSIDISSAWDVLFPKPEGSIGYIFYDKGYYSDGWRYLEAAPADLKLIDGVPSVDRNKPGYDGAEDEFLFGYYRTSTDGQNLFVNGSPSYNALDCTDKDVETGMRNTELLVRAMGDSAYENPSGDKKTSNYAAKLCMDLVYTDEEGNAYDNWFLPSRDELNLMFSLLKQQGMGDFPDTYYDDYWSSTEYVYYPGNAWYQYFSDGDVYDGNRDYYFRVRPVRAL